MKAINYIKFLATAFVMLLALQACKWGTKKPAPQGRNLLCFVDFSDPNKASSRLQFYADVIKNDIIAKMGKYDKITVMAVDAASLTNSSDIIVRDFSTKNFVPDQVSPTDEDELTNENLAKFKDTVAQAFLKAFHKAILMRQQSSHGTDIFGAIEVTSSRLKAGSNYLIFLSDMMNWSNRLKMEPADKDFTSQPLEYSLNKAPNYRLPNCAVLVLTAPQADIGPEHFRLVQTFWTSYFEKNHIELIDYNSGSVTKLDELMANGNDRQ